MKSLESASAELAMIAQIRQRMETYHPRRLPLPLVPEAAVLLPITRAPEPELILTVRTKDMPTHAGEVAFPGGRHAKGESLLQTALRESHEEVGLTPGRVELLGQLSPLASKHMIKVTPFVGLVDADVPLVADPGEIDEIFRVPLAFFRDQTPDLSAPFDFFGKRFRLPSYYHDDKRIWGLTALMIIDLVNHVFDTNISVE